MAPLKASSIDGLYARFYQLQWSIIGDSLVSFLRKGFEDGEVEPFLNKIFIVLIVKVVGPEVVT